MSASVPDHVPMMLADCPQFLHWLAVDPSAHENLFDQIYDFGPAGNGPANYKSVQHLCILYVLHECKYPPPPDKRHEFVTELFAAHASREKPPLNDDDLAAHKFSFW